ncbi:uncharacterized protein [Amphiura filiformis]|uniref:uncharacterized protein isoform X3 n=1 Tax=Amphiura filiformis TaxID=82378 RepID=UPI003B216DA1
MTSRLLQPDLDMSKPTPSMPNLAGSAPLFSLGSLCGQQPSSMHHPYNRQSREDRLRCIQRRLGLNPDTGKPFASRSQGSSATAPSASISVESTKQTNKPEIARNPLLGSSAFNFAMKQRSLASTYKKRSQSTSGADDVQPATAPLFPQLPMFNMGMPLPLYQEDASGVTQRTRHVSSPSGLGTSQPEVVSQPETVPTQLSHREAVPTQYMAEDNPGQVEPHVSNVESSVQEAKAEYEEAAAQYQYQQEHSGDHETSVSAHVGTTSYGRESDETHPQNQPEVMSYETQPEAMSYQTETYQSEEMGSEYFVSPDKVDNQYQSNQYQPQQQYYGEQEVQQVEQTGGQVDTSQDGDVVNQWESLYTSQEGNSNAPETDGSQTYMQLDPIDYDQASDPVNSSQSIESLSQDSQPEVTQDPAPVATDVPKFPKSEAIKATRSKSPTEDLGQRWDDLPHQLKSRVVPRMTRSGGVTLKAIGKSEQAGKPSVKRKGSAAWSGTSGVGGLAPIDDVDGGWTTVVGKKKKKPLDIIEQQQQEQQQQQQQKHEAPKPLSKGIGSLDKIHSALARQFPGLTRKEVMETMKQVRVDHLGSLSGVSMAVLVKEASSHIKNSNPRYMVSKPAGNRHDECDDICVICQDDLRTMPGGSKRGSSHTALKIRMLDCGHMFHDECLKVWYDTKERTCPMCRCHTLLPEDFPRLI